MASRQDGVLHLALSITPLLHGPCRMQHTENLQFLTNEIEQYYVGKTRNSSATAIRGTDGELLWIGNDLVDAL